MLPGVTADGSDQNAQDDQEQGESEAPTDDEEIF